MTDPAATAVRITPASAPPFCMTMAFGATAASPWRRQRFGPIFSALAATSRQSALAAALAENGRVERGIFTLEWMSEPDLRHRVQAGLNKGEARDNLARAVFPIRLGQKRDRTHDDQRRRAAGRNLAVSAIVLWNIVHLTAAVGALRRSAVDATDDLLRHVRPLGRDHVSLTGDYRWSVGNPKTLDQPLPLRLYRPGVANPA